MSSDNQEIENEDGFFSTDLLSVEQLERYGAALARKHEITPTPGPDRLLNNLAYNEAILKQSYENLTKKPIEDDNFSPSREWLLDNFYLIQEHILSARRHLSKGYANSLPKLESNLVGYPRVFDIALQLIKHSDGHWNLGNLQRFIAAYQNVTFLTLGELWAIPIMLGIVLIQNLRRASQLIIAERNDRILAASWANRIIDVAIADPKQLIISLADMARTQSNMSDSFVAELARRFQSAGLALPLTYLDEHLLEEGLSVEQIVQKENRQRAATQVSIRNSIESLRSINETNWQDFVQTMSIVERILQADPIGIYSKMDFASRDLYRHAIERLARASLKPEKEVASIAIELAKSKADLTLGADNNCNSGEVRLCHIGFYLIDKGIYTLEKLLGIHFSVWQKISRYCMQHVLQLYLGSSVLTILVITFALLYKANQSGLNITWLCILGFVFFICISQPIIDFVNLIATLIIKPKKLPQMDFSDGIPKNWSTAVVIPVLLSNKKEIEKNIKDLEIRYLANSDKNLHFILLTDFTDAPHEQMPEDMALLELTKDQIESLNSCYGKNGDIFFHFHRHREWNSTEQIWMGRERKRGKLTDFNSYLRKKNSISFAQIVGDTKVLTNIKNIITLDSDTQLPRDTAQKLVAIMAHPLNWPYRDIDKNYIVSGYGILQPRIAEAIPQAGLTRFVRLCGGEFGIDPYTSTVSNVHQDLFQEGCFMGKGIYDVDSYDQVLTNRLPNNRILSHDLLEGCYLRSAFISNIVLYENMPKNYLSDVKRRIRWMRGDWQLLSWLFPWVRDRDNQIIDNPLSILSKFKLFDNLRRSLVPVFLLLFLGLSLTVLPINFFWMSIFSGILLFPTLINIIFDLGYKIKINLKDQRFTHLSHLIGKQVGQLLFYLACLPFEAWYSLNAIVKTIWRLTVTKKNLLEWVPSNQIEDRLNSKLITYIKIMWPGPIVAFLVIANIFFENKWQLLPIYLPLLLLWFISPLIAYWLSKPYQALEPRLKMSQLFFLHQVARKTWEYFNVFITTENNWLPPDNVQEAPVDSIAKRTSPTNIGMYLLANLTAYDFNYIYMSQLLERTQNTFQSLFKLERFKGHFLNWYDIETLKPLYPRYVSTVDSGNLAGHLLTLRQGLLALHNERLLKEQLLDGLQDTFDVLMTTIDRLSVKELMQFQKLLNDSKAVFTSWQNAASASKQLCESAKKILKLDLLTIKSKEWANKLLSQCEMLHNEIKIFSDIPNLSDNVTLKMLAEMAANKLSHPGIHYAIERIKVINSLADQAFQFAQMEMDFLYTKNNLLVIGFNVEDHRLDNSKYDLLSSEVRLGIFVAIAYSQINQKSWFALGRQFVSSGGKPILISWSGSMFEYLMPLLVMPTYPFTLLNETYRAIVNRQITYGKKRNVPWGVSESCFNALDSHFNYLYRAFGVPGLGLKRGLEEDLVVAPYASALALMVSPKAACHNLERIAREFGLGDYGLYEAIDFTPSRQVKDSKAVLIRSFMTHHQGMIFLGFSYLLHNKLMQQRFNADPYFKATLLLLQERFPVVTDRYFQIPQIHESNPLLKQPEASMRIFTNPNTRTPQVNLLSNGNYHTVLTQAGGGYSRYKDIALTRWREDSTCDNWGLFTYVRDMVTGQFYSTSYQPTGKEAENYRCVFTEGHVEFDHKQDALDMHTEIVVSPEDNIELRRIRIYNHSSITRMIEITSYGEIVLAPQAADISQPAFSNLFVETEILTSSHAILAKRRTSDDQALSPWLFHLLNVYSEQSYKISFETDRSRFIGRARSPTYPLALFEQAELSNTSGSVLDPIFAIRCRSKLNPNKFIVFDFLTGVSETREGCLKLAQKYQSHNLANRIFELAWTHGQVLLHQLNITIAEAQVYNRLASPIIYSSKTRRAKTSVLLSNRRGQSDLWQYAISGDLPLLILQIDDAENIEIVHQVIKAHAYWRRKGLDVDVIILNGEHHSYQQTLQNQIISLINATTITATEHNGSIIVRKLNEISEEDLILLQSVAKIILSDARGSLKEQLSFSRVSGTSMPPPLITASYNKALVHKQLGPLPSDLQFFNGKGGFTADGKEYLIRLKENMTTPAPWCNILVNPNFGTLISESGQGYTWIENSQQFRLTPWDNDPLEDRSGEAFYVRDDVTGAYWSPTPLPCRGRGDYQIRHGFGYSIFEHIEDGLHSEFKIYVARDAPIKFCSLKISNHSTYTRSLSVFGFIAWVLGDLRDKHAFHIVTESTANGVIFAQNHYNTDFGERIAFFTANTSNTGLRTRTLTGDRSEFLGRNGTSTQPAALKRKTLSGRVGAGYDPCGAIQLTFDLKENKSRKIIFLLGAAQNKQAAEKLLEHYRDETATRTALSSIREFWQQKLGKIKVETSNVPLNLLANGWLLYQVISSRLWGRTGYYQSSGAFGFRDQLQDVMALSYAAPDLYRAHLRLCAAHQFEEGDVQHWWHPPFNRGIRTRCSDDYLWLPFALCHYIERINDLALLEESIPFLKGRPLRTEEDSYYETATISNEVGSMYQHAVRAIQYGLKFGIHGLPLMGSGDWNDGMNKVGKEGRGESVWLGFFLCIVLKRFSKLAKQYGDTSFAATCEIESQKLENNIELSSWDGEWYRRAYFDDGTPLGSVNNSECRIDSISQSWAIISKVANSGRAKRAMNSMYHCLVSREDKLVKLLDPPFNKSRPSPGYIEAYLPGIRENGGQYTHAAAWAIMAFAELNENERAWELFNFINPINHGRDEAGIMRYKIEPYVIAGDVYSVTPHVGRGGWSWYTGSAGWLYNVIIETLLGLRLVNGNQLYLNFILPKDCERFKINYEYGNTNYEIIVNKVHDKKRLILDGKETEKNFVELEDDGKTHYIYYLY